MLNRFVASLPSVLLFYAMLHAPALASEDSDMTSWFVSVDNDRDVSIDVGIRDETVLFSIHDVSGIGSAILSPAHGKWPVSIVFHVYTQGLESFSVSNGKLTSYTSVTTHHHPKILCEVKDTGNHGMLSASDSSPYCMPTVIQAGEAGNSIPLRDGYFEMSLPYSMIEGDPSELVVRWVDFFR